MKWNEILPELYKTPFKYGGYSPEGMDCVGLIYYYCQQRGKPFPESFEGYTIENYGSYVENTVEQNNRLLQGLYGQLGSEISVKDILAGDLILAQTNEGQLVIAIYIGNGHIVTPWLGHRIMALSINRDLHPVMARRL